MLECRQCGPAPFPNFWLRYFVGHSQLFEGRVPRPLRGHVGTRPVTFTLRISL